MNSSLLLLISIGLPIVAAFFVLFDLKITFKITKDKEQDNENKGYE